MENRVIATASKAFDNGKLTPAYVEQTAAEAYVWAWPMINIANRLKKFEPLTQPVLLNGIAPVGPINRLSMLTDYIKPEERDVACPNQDVVYGSVVLNLEKEPVIVQVPDFKGRFWVYQIVDQRTDGFAQLGAMYGTKPGFYMLVGPNYAGDVPAKVKKVFRSTTNIGYSIPRVFKKATDADRDAVLPIISQVNIYPLSEFTGEMKVTDWTKLPSLGTGEKSTADKGEASWVIPDMAVEEIDAILTAVPPMSGEEALYANFRTVVAAAKKDPALKKAFIAGATRAEKEIVTPLLQFGNYGIQLKDHWSTINNSAAFGTDYFTRLAAAKSNIFVNAPNETKYFYQDFDKDGKRLDGKTARYEVTFPKGKLPPVKGFWSLTMYDKHHFFVPNKLERYSLGTKNENLVYNPDGSLTIYVQAEMPSKDKMANWLPAPKDVFSLYIRAYWPEKATLNGTWTPPAVVRK